MIWDWLVAVIVVLGAALALVGSIGTARLPDTLTRMQAATKAGAIGVALLLLAVALHLPEIGPTARALMGVAFILLTAPVAGQVIARAAYLDGVQLWEGTRRDDLRESGDLARILEAERETDRREREGLL